MKYSAYLNVAKYRFKHLVEALEHAEVVVAKLFVQIDELLIKSITEATRKGEDE